MRVNPDPPPFNVPVRAPVGWTCALPCYEGERKAGDSVTLQVSLRLVFAWRTAPVFKRLEPALATEKRANKDFNPFYLRRSDFLFLPRSAPPGRPGDPRVAAGRRPPAPAQRAHFRPDPLREGPSSSLPLPAVRGRSGGRGAEGAGVGERGAGGGRAPGGVGGRIGAPWGAASAVLFPPQARRQHVAATGMAGRAGWGVGRDWAGRVGRGSGPAWRFHGSLRERCSGRP